MKIMGTGSRSMVKAPDAKIIYENLEAKVLMLSAKYPDLQLISGMAEGWDEAIAKVAQRNGIPYIVMIPNQGYGDYYWRRNSVLGYDRSDTFKLLVKHASQVIYVCKALYVDGVHSNFVRNQAMVDACDGALVYKPESAGTRDAIARLKAANKPYMIAPFKV